MINQTLRSIALGCTLIVGMTVTALAQSTEGGIRGTVVDPSGALIVSAQVTISNATGFTRTLKSDAEGAFEVENLAPGSYSINIDAVGFTPGLEGDVRVSQKKMTSETIKLGISVNQQIEVLAN